MFLFWSYLSLCRKTYRSTSDLIDISIGAGCTELPMGAGDLVSPSGLEHCMITPTFEEGREIEPGSILRFQGFDSEVDHCFLLLSSLMAYSP